MSLGTLFIASLLPVLKVAMLCGVGAFTAAKGLLTLEGRRIISALIFNVFVPCLFLDNLGSGVGFMEAIRLWPLTFNILSAFALGALLGLLAVYATNTPKELRRHMVLCAMNPNAVNMPLVLIGSLGADPAFVALGGAALGIQYIVLSNLIATFVQIPVAVILLRKPEGDDNSSSSSSSSDIAGQQDVEAAGNTTNTTGDKLGKQPPPPPPHKGSAQEEDEETGGGQGGGVGGGGDQGGGGVAPHQPLLHGQSQSSSLDLIAVVGLVGTEAGSGAGTAGAGAARERWKTWWLACKPTVTCVVSPPTISCMLGLAIASVPPVQDLFFSPTGGLRVVAEVVRMLANMTIPCLMLVLGANLSRGPGVASIPKRCIVAMIAVRLVVGPLAGTALVQVMRGAGLLGGLAPIGIIVMLLNHALPTAILMHSMATMYSSREDDVAALLFWQYLACALTLPLVMAFFLHLVV